MEIESYWDCLKWNSHANPIFRFLLYSFTAFWNSREMKTKQQTILPVLIARSAQNTPAYDIGNEEILLFYSSFQSTDSEVSTIQLEAITSHILTDIWELRDSFSDIWSNKWAEMTIKAVRTLGVNLRRFVTFFQN